MTSYPTPNVSEVRERLDGRPLIVSMSGGKDSTACALLLRELGLEFTMVHMDTQWEASETEDYVRNYLPRVLGQEIQVIGSKMGFAELCLHKGIFPSRLKRWCTKSLKIKPFQRFMQQQPDEPVAVVGIRRQESAKRSDAKEWEFSDLYDAMVWRPLVDWSFDDVIAIHNEHGVLPNPLYLKGATRVGCWPCIYSRKEELALMSRIDPDRVSQIERLEEDVCSVQLAKISARGEEPEANWVPPTLFRSRKPGEAMPIRKVIEWAQTTRGGKQRALFVNLPEDGGCMRWGLCDASGDGWA